nr:putative ribonuclease H-like domain-containing protein [Tanacetum cinerariifolium]
MAQQVIPAAQLVQRFHTIRRCNSYAVLQSIPCSFECKIVGQILLDHPLGYALTATADVPVFVYTVDMFRDILQLLMETPDSLFFVPVNIKNIEAFMNKVGYQATEAQENIAKVQEKLAEEEIEKLVKGNEDEESYASEFADSVLNDDVDDSVTRLEPGSHKENLEKVDDDEVEIEKEKKDDIEIEKEKKDDVEIEKEKKDEEIENEKNNDNVEETNKVVNEKDIFDDEINTLKDKMIVDKYINMKQQTSVTEASNWSKDMIRYFKDRWKEDIRKEQNKKVDEFEDVLENASEAMQNFMVKVVVGVNSNILKYNGCRIMVGWDINVVSIIIVYAANRGTKKRALWKELTTVQEIVKDEPWILLGFLDCVNMIEVMDVCVGNVRHGYLKGGRGLRQGDTLSPYLFTLLMEVFTLIMAKNIQNDNGFKYHSGLKVVKETLMEFNSMSCLLPNTNKSIIFFGNVKAEERLGILNILPFRIRHLLVKYLGVPLLTIRILFAIACTHDFVLYQMDVKSTFLNDFINEEVYVAQPSGVIITTSVSRPQLKSNPIGDRVMRNNSQGKKQDVEDHCRSVKFSKNKTSVPACNDSLNAKTLNVNFVCATCEIVIFIVDSGCSKHMTGNLKLLINFVEKFLGTVKFGNDQIAPILGYGDLVQGAVTIKRVYYVEGLNHNLFSVDHLCSSCELGKAKRKSFHTKITPSSKRRLQLLHMDLCGPMRVASINGKKYVLVIVDDYSRYTWTHFLRSKDETPEVLIDFLKLVQRGLHAQVRIVQTDKGTKFLNKTLHAYFASEGILHQTSVARTPEQNGVVERRNRTLVEAARTMLSAAKVPLFFWAEAIAKACFTQNRSLVILRHEKTPYHIINERKPSVKFFHIFGSLCYIVRDGENLDK